MLPYQNRIVAFITISLFFLVFPHSLRAHELAMDCKVIPGASPALNCINHDALTSEKKIIQVTTRPMPGFLTLGGVTIIDICEFPHIKDAIKNGEYIAKGEVFEKLLAKNKSLGCMRRYCSQNMNYVSFVVKDAVIPLPPTLFIRTSFGFYKANFTMTCDYVNEGVNP